MNPEQEWIKRLREGDGSALSKLMDRYGNDVYRTAILLIKDRHLAEDISQEAFLAAFQNIRQFRGQGSLRAWLLRITVNLCRSKMRLAAWKRLLYRDMTDDAIPSMEPGPEQAAARLSLMSDIQQLPYMYRVVIVLYYYQELTIKEIAAALGESEGTVKSKLSRGRTLLRSKLEEGDGVDGATT